MRDETLPPSLAREGLLMRDALARDLSDLPDVTLVTTHDDRLPPPPGAASVPVSRGRNPWQLWSYCAAAANAAWVIAPETAKTLERLTEACAGAGTVVGCDLETIRIAASKRATARRLIDAGVPALPVWTFDETPDEAGPLVTKPDDGAGCEATRYWPGRPDAAALPRGHVVQPYEPGEAASITVLRSKSGASVLSINRQHVVIEDDGFGFHGLTVGDLGDPDGRLAAIAEGVVRAMPGLDGIFGVDVVIGDRGPVVVEVNPRITTSYVGLRAALGANPASLVCPFAEPGVAPPPLAARSVEVAL